MKSLLIAIVLMFVIPTSAQEKKSEHVTKREHRLVAENNNAEALAKGETKKLTKQLDLSSDQERQVYDAYLNHFVAELEMKQKAKTMITSKNDSDKKEIKSTIEAKKSELSKTLQDRLKTILTASQFRTFQEKNLSAQKTKQKVIIRKN